MRTVRLTNLNAYKLGPTEQGTADWTARVTAIREAKPDILTLQFSGRI
ncbi:hypothetical protein [Streptomyces sp. SBT349]|nr:hypothetical protein [Streptomyces sp. SBT349]